MGRRSRPPWTAIGGLRRSDFVETGAVEGAEQRITLLIGMVLGVNVVDGQNKRLLPWDYWMTMRDKAVLCLKSGRISHETRSLLPDAAGNTFIIGTFTI